MRGKVYIETSVISYLTSRPSRDVVVAGHQQITQEWWSDHSNQYELFISQAVLEEVAAGDPLWARSRLEAINNIPLLEISAETVALAKDFLQLGCLPTKAEVDALHIAIAATNRIDFLLTWNCKHLANARLRNPIERICLARNYYPVIICTPEELLEV
jgi:hypothetical protein